MGDIHLFAVDYLPTDLPLFRDQGYNADSDLWFVVGDSGLIGLSLLLCNPLFGVQGHLLMRRNLTLGLRQDAPTALAVVLVTMVSFLLCYDVSFFLISGFVMPRSAVLRTEAMVSLDGRASC